NTTFDIGGAKITLKAASNLTIDGKNISGKALGEFAAGPVQGSFGLEYGEGGLDGEISLDKATVPFLTVGGVKLTAKGIGTKNEVTVGGDINVSIADGLVEGKLGGMPYKGGLQGDVTLKANVPGVELGELKFHVGPGWKLTNQTPELDLKLDMGGLLGKLEALKAKLGGKSGDLKSLPSVIGDISVE